MKKDFIQGYFLIAAAIIGPIATWVLTSKNHKVELQAIRDNSVEKEILHDAYIEKDEYNDLKQNGAVLSGIISRYKNQIDSLSQELSYIKTKYSKVAKAPDPAAKLEADNTLIEIEKAYQSGKYIVVDIRITNLGNDKKYYGVEKYNTVVKTDDGKQYEIKKVLKGGNNTHMTYGDIFNKEEVFYSLYFGDVSSQLTYNTITFRSVTTDKTAILQRIAL